MGKRILYIQYTNPANYPSLGNSSQILAGKGWRVWFIGTGTFGKNKTEFISHPKIKNTKIPFCRPGFFQKAHYGLFCLGVTLLSIFWRATVVYCSDSLSCPIGWVLSYVPWIKVLYHEHDSPDVDNLRQQNSIYLKSIIWTRKQLAKRADFCVLPNQKRLEAFQNIRESNKNIFCVWNCPALNEIPVTSADRNESFFWVLYHGSIVPERFPLSVLNALELLPSQVGIRLVGYETVGALGYTQTFLNHAKAKGLQDRLDIIGCVPTRRDLFQQTLRSHAGIIFLPKKSDDFNIQNMTGASNKVFDYLACGLPVLVSNLEDWKAMFVSPGYGQFCDSDDPASIAQAIRWFVEHPKDAQEMGRKGHQKIAEDWNYDSQFKPVLEALESIGSR